MKTTNKAPQKQIGFLETLAINVVISVGVFFLLNQFFAKDQDLAPPVLVVDYAEIANKYPEDQAESDRIMIKTSELIAKFRDAGFLVLDTQNVIAAPKDLYLPIEAIYE